MSAEEYQPSTTTASVLAHSVIQDLGATPGFELITVEATFARSALAELNTHRAFSRNSASSRAIPVSQMLRKATEEPFIPRRFSIAQKGMSASEFVEPGDGAWEDCVNWWIESRDVAVAQAKKGLDLGLHKQDVNRILEPFLMHTAIISATEWGNFFTLRLARDEQGNPLAYPPMFDLAQAIYTAIQTSQHPSPKWIGQWYPPPVSLPQHHQNWHLPLTGFATDHEDLTVLELIQVSAARCARVSYLTHEGRRDVQADLTLFKRLFTNGHLSPFEHVAHASPVGSGNFQYWRQLRYYIERGLFQ